MSVFCQQFNGFASSNFSGINGISLQPASIADSRFAVDISLAGLNLMLYNNYVSLDANALGIKDAFNDPQFEEKYIRYEASPKKDLGFTINNNISLPSFMVTLSPKHAFALTWNVRSIFNIDGISKELGILLKNGLDYSTLHYVKINENELDIQYMSWAEYGLGYARELYNNDEHYIKAGFKLKIVQGLNAFYFSSDDLSYMFKTSDTINVYNTHSNVGFTTLPDQDPNKSFLGNNYRFIAKPALGLDLGVVYEYRPDFENYKYDMDGKTGLWRRDKNKYKFKAGLSLLDMGNLKFEKYAESHSFLSNLENLKTDNFNDISDPAVFDSTMLENYILDSEADFFRMKLPLALSLQLDYNIIKSVYVNFNSHISFKRKKKTSKLHGITQYSLTPRWENAWFDFSLPLVYDMYNNLRMGFNVKVGFWIVGTNNMGALFQFREVKGADLFLAIKVPIPYKKPMDFDEDKVSDKLDECPVKPGIWEFKGCPDTDNDGLKDNEDNCPNDAGPVKLGGCPDKDGDEIIDKEDECPDDKGPAEFKGCPDKDEDKVIDKEDECPDIAGLPEYKGCPDRDGDGIIDKKDACPEQMGLEENNGCPDTDEDGIIDKEDMCPVKWGPKRYQGCPDTDSDGLTDNIDRCPETPGPLDNRGCPYKDKDGDGIVDVKDDCPRVFGPVENKGCPYLDTDKDGVLDENDECPETPGPLENKGCPELEEEEEEILNTAFDNLEFETGKAIIKFDSYASLEQLGLLLVKKSDWKLKLEGHTDNVGSAQSNLSLSKKRANAVKKFLTDRGIDTSRVSVEFYGESKPISDNETDEGRQKNRRVVMTVIFD